MQGLILAAGMGKRLKELTNNNTKCMVKVNNISIIERTLSILDKKNLSKIIIVVGYKKEELMQYIDTLNISTPIKFINNSVYYKTNNIYSLALAKKYLCEEDTLLLESDLVFNEDVIDTILNDKRKNLALVDKFENWMDGTCVEIDDEDNIIDFIPRKNLNFSRKNSYYKTVNIYKFNSDFSKNMYVPFLEAYEKAMGENEYYESVIKLIAMLDNKQLFVKRLNGELWYEIDNIQDLNIAESLFANNESEKYKNITLRYGGYWRYPKLLDFCYLVNPYYPPKKLTEEIKSNFETLLTEYPSGMAVNSLLASDFFSINQNHIIIGNGAAELIKGLIESFDSDMKMGTVYPTFEEYPNRFKKTNIIPFIPQNDDFRYSVNDLIQFYTNNKVDFIVLINPDNPSGNYINYEDTLTLIKWCKENQIKLIIDESFVDFAELQNSQTLKDISLIKESVLSMYSELYIIKSISKSYGVPGVRLGILASSNEEKISFLKKDVSIWNINSYGEFFLQIAEKYSKDYDRALDKLRQSRKDLIQALSKLNFIKVFPSSANYIMCMLEGITSEKLCCILLKNNILIKDLTKKISNGKQYIRIAIRNNKDNKIIIDELTKINNIIKINF